jgi:hypothetical protein
LDVRGKKARAFVQNIPIFTSKRTLRSLWQQYRIYRDRVELQSWILFHTVVVPAEEIESLEVNSAVLCGGKVTWFLVLDYSSFVRHVILKRKSGMLRSMAFSPDEPDKFVEICKSTFACGARAE